MGGVPGRRHPQVALTQLLAAVAAARQTSANIGLFHTVPTLSKGTELLAYAAGKQLPQPLSFIACAAPTRTAQVGDAQR
jgi:hypothetical protein